MKPTIISRNKNEVQFSMEFTGEEFENAKMDAYRASKNKYTVDGFRKGKAPKSLIEARFGETVFFEDAINQMYVQNYPKATEELNLRIIGNPSVEFSDIKKGEGFTITLTAEAYPEFEVTDYKGVKVEKVDADVENSQVEEELLALQKRNARMVIVDRAACDGDSVLIDYEGYIGEEQFAGGTAERYMLKLGSNTFIPGFEEQLIGVKPGEDREIKVPFPEDYQAPELAGKEALFKCKIHEIKEEELPELDDDFAKDVSEQDTLKELKSEIKDRLKKTAEQRAESQMRNALIEKVYNANEIDVPEAMVNEETDTMLSDFEIQLRNQGVTLEKYLEYVNKDIADVKSEFQGNALTKVKTRMMLSKISDQEDLGATPEEIETEITAIAAQYGMEVDKVKAMMGDRITIVETDIKVKKAVDFIFENAEIK